MRYRLEFCSSHTNTIIIHVDKMTENGFWFLHGLKEEDQPMFVRDLFNTEGVISVGTERYKVILMKGEVFEWKEMISAILFAIQNHFSPEEELVEVGPPIQSEDPSAETADINAG